MKTKEALQKGPPRAIARVIPSSEKLEPYWSRPLPTPQATCDASSPRRRLSPSQLDLEVLLSQALDAETTRLLQLAYSPLFPSDAPYSHIDEIPGKVAERDTHVLTAVAEGVRRYRDELMAAAGEIGSYLHYTEDDVRGLAMKLAKQSLDPYIKLAAAEKLLGVPVPGDTFFSRLARVCDARFWRRALRVRIVRAREYFFLRLHLIGRGKEVYASQAAVSLRASQLKRQVQWMKNTVLIPRFHEALTEGDEKYQPLTLEQVVAGPKERFAKLYAFAKAIDTLGQEANLSSAMVTLTLEPEWHPNPSHGTYCWNKASPREAHQSLCDRWQAILRDLHRIGIRLSGLRVAEPHQDSCPHWHIWLLYRPEHESTILATLMKYFPNKLKIRAPSRRGEKNTHDDRMFDSRQDVIDELSRPLTHAKEGAQVEVSRINRDISSGAGYAMKYLLKTVDAGEELNKQVGLFNEEDAKIKNKKKKHRQNAKRVDAFRSLWGINQGQLFGVAKCLTAWDELRRLSIAPKHRALKKLWVLARGGAEEGRIEAGSGQRGDATGFLRALGGLDASRNGKAKSARRFVLGRLLEDSLNSYGEVITRTKGITLLMKQKVKVPTERVRRATGEVVTSSVWRTKTTVVASVRTRWIDWMLVPIEMAEQTLCRHKVLEQHALEQIAVKKRRASTIQVKPAGSLSESALAL